MVEDHVETGMPSSSEWVHFRPKMMNTRMYGPLAADPTKRLIEVLAPGINLYAYDDKFVVLNMTEATVLYLMDFRSSVNAEQRIISNIRLWRNKSQIFTHNLGSKLFFDFLLPLADIVEIDGYAHSYGKSFWELRISEAMHRKYAIYIQDLSTGVRRAMTDYDELYELGTKWWDDGSNEVAVKLSIAKPA